MNRFRLICPLLVIFSFAGFHAVSAAEEQEPTKAERLFALKVQPLLREKCLGCHGDKPNELEGAFDIRSRESLLKGGESFGGDVLVPGDASKSDLYSVVRRVDPDTAMPPKEADRLTKEETWWIRDWINGGSPWPNDARVADIYKRYAAGVTVKTSGGLDEKWTNRKYKPEDLWAWQPLWKDKTEKLNKDARGRNPVDVLIDARLQEEGIQAAPRADRRMLIRRATFDLLGLPPKPADVNSFVKDSRDDKVAFAALVDRLLESPHYGEQWGRHWLDVVRYADSSGFANDWERPNAWRYRDYVIRAFNDDKPYDAFITEQLAGDEIAAMKQNINAKKPDWVPASSFDLSAAELQIAVGFLRMGPWEHTGMSVAKVTRQLFLDDVTDSVGQVFLGHALQCCRCHDHKFDPIPTRDYYSFQAVFATTQFAEVEAGWIPGENLGGMEEDRRYHDKRRNANAEMMKGLAVRNREHLARWFKGKGLSYKSREEAIKAGFPPKDIPPQNALKTPDDFGRDRIGRKWQTRFNWERQRYQPVAFSVYNGVTRRTLRVTGPIGRPSDVTKGGELEKTAILKGGDPFAAGGLVKPGVLSAVPGALDASLPIDVAGRRLALAEWMIGPQNSLTLRVIVNRIWHYHFGRGIAGNPNNFGATGKKPTHLKLLDWLAGEFVKPSTVESAGPWSIKHLHRLVMNSEAYRRSSTHPKWKLLKQQDSNGDSYAVFRPRRLAAEELRDSMLAVSGELNPEGGGIPIRPDMNLEAALQPRMIMGTFAPSYVPNSRPSQRNRRSVYALKARGHRDPFMETFNQPGSEKSCEIRDSSTVTPQALTLINSEETRDRALAFAARVLKAAGSDDGAINRIYELAFNRAPDSEELMAAREFWRRMKNTQAGIEYKPRELPTTVLRRAVEENTGEHFTFEERLFVYEDYVPDLQPHQVDIRTRALADVCLAILNSNEFIYVY